MFVRLDRRFVPVRAADGHDEDTIPSEGLGGSSDDTVYATYNRLSLESPSAPSGEMDRHNPNRCQRCRVANGV
jgi:hypothetical protein